MTEFQLIFIFIPKCSRRQQQGETFCNMKSYATHKIIKPGKEQVAEKMYKVRIKIAKRAKFYIWCVILHMVCNCTHYV